MVVNHDDNIYPDVKYCGKKENLEVLKKEFSYKEFKYMEVLGFNNIIEKAK